MSAEGSAWGEKYAPRADALRERYSTARQNAYLMKTRSPAAPTSAIRPETPPLNRSADLISFFSGGTYEAFGAIPEKISRRHHRHETTAHKD